MKTTVKVLGYTNEGLTIVELSNGQYDSIVLYNENTFEVDRELEFSEYLSLDKAEANNDQLGSISKVIVSEWFESLVATL